MALIIIDAGALIIFKSISDTTKIGSRNVILANNTFLIHVCLVRLANSITVATCAKPIMVKT